MNGITGFGSLSAAQPTSTSAANQAKQTTETSNDVKKQSAAYSRPTYVTSANTSIRRVTEEFLTGKIDMDELMSFFESKFERSLQNKIVSGSINPNDPKQIGELLQYEYDTFKMSMLSGAVIASNNQGAAKYGQDPYPIYFNADYYYATEEILEAMNAKFYELAQGHGADDLQLDSHTQWNDYLDVWRHTWGALDTEAGPPPPGFELCFYKEKYSHADRMTDTMFDAAFYVTEETAQGSTGHTFLMGIPRGAPLLRALSLFTIRQLGKPTMVDGYPRYNLTSLLKDAPGAGMYEKLKAWVVENVTDFYAGALTVSCGDWRLDTDLPFSLMTERYTVEGADLVEGAAENPGADYLKHFTFTKTPPYIGMNYTV